MTDTVGSFGESNISETIRDFDSRWSERNASIHKSNAPNYLNDTAMCTASKMKLGSSLNTNREPNF